MGHILHFQDLLAKDTLGIICTTVEKENSQMKKNHNHLKDCS